MTSFAFYAPDRARACERYVAEYVFVQVEPTPWTPLRRDLRRCTAAWVSTAGLRLKTQHSHQPPWAGFREISAYVAPEEVAFDFTTYDPSEAERDLNVLVPVDRLKALVDRGALGGLHETFFSFFGLCEDLGALRASASYLGERLSGSGVDVVFAAPAGRECNRTVGLIARELERYRISTVCAVTLKEVALQVRPPRAVFINFPFGRTFGPAGDVPLQESIVTDMARALRTLDRPGQVVDLTYRWSGVLE